MIYLSNFRTAGKDKRAVSIAAMTPKDFEGEVRKDLAPKLSTLTAYKKGEITDMEYIAEYVNVIYSHDIDRLAEELDGHVLLCYCPKTALCHRLLLAQYLHLETRVEFEEIGGFAEAWQVPVKNKAHPLEMALSEDMLNKCDLHGKFPNDNIVGHWRELKKIGALDIFTAGFTC